jgi:hypothetical protein
VSLNVWGEESWDTAISETFPVALEAMPALVREAVSAVLHLSILDLDSDGGFLVRTIGLGLTATTISLAIRFLSVDEDSTRVDVKNRLNTAYGTVTGDAHYTNELLSAIRSHVNSQTAHPTADPLPALGPTDQ